MRDVNLESHWLQEIYSHESNEIAICNLANSNLKCNTRSKLVAKGIQKLGSDGRKSLCERIIERAILMMSPLRSGNLDQGVAIHF